MRRLGLADHLVHDVCTLIRYHDLPIAPERASLLRAMSLLSREGRDVPRLMGELFDLKRSDTLGKAFQCFYYVDEIERMREMARELVANGEPYCVKMLAISGSDLIAAGVAPGPGSASCFRARSTPSSSTAFPIAPRTCCRHSGSSASPPMDRGAATVPSPRQSSSFGAHY